MIEAARVLIPISFLYVLHTHFPECRVDVLWKVPFGNKLNGRKSGAWNTIVIGGSACVWWTSCTLIQPLDQVIAASSPPTWPPHRLPLSLSFPLQTLFSVSVYRLPLSSSSSPLKLFTGFPPPSPPSPPLTSLPSPPFHPSRYPPITSSPPFHSITASRAVKPHRLLDPL